MILRKILQTEMLLKDIQVQRKDKKRDILWDNSPAVNFKEPDYTVLHVHSLLQYHCVHGENRHLLKNRYCLFKAPLPKHLLSSDWPATTWQVLANTCSLASYCVSKQVGYMLTSACDGSKGLIKNAGFRAVQGLWFCLTGYFSVGREHISTGMQIRPQ